MRRLVGLGAAFVLTTAALSFSAGSAVADGGTSCATGSGTAKFSPGLSTEATAQNIVVKGAVTGCTGGTFTDGTFLLHLPRDVALLTCDSLSTGTADVLNGKAIVKWQPAGSKNSQAAVTGTLTGSSQLHVTGTITKGTFVGLTLTTDLVLTPQFKTFPPTAKNLPAPCAQKNRLKKAAYSSSAFAIT